MSFDFCHILFVAAVVIPFFFEIWTKYNILVLLVSLLHWNLKENDLTGILQMKSTFNMTKGVVEFLHRAKQTLVNALFSNRRKGQCDHNFDK